MKKAQNKKWFTLVELIIVITILAILGTIWFVSFQWYTADARNTKRTSDLSSLQWALEAKRAWTSLSLVWFVDSTTSSKITDPNMSIAWQIVASSWTLYNAWIMNFALLGIWAESFKDPNWFDYSFGATSLKNWQYQFAATLEWEQPTAIVKWDYKNRTATGSKVTWVVSARNNKMFQITDTATLWRLFVWDTVTDWINNRIVKNVSSDLTYITVNDTIQSGTTSLELALNEFEWLIGNYATASDWTAWDWSEPVTDWSTIALPY